MELSLRLHYQNDRSQQSLICVTEALLALDNLLSLLLSVVAPLEFQIQDTNEDDVQEETGNAPVHAVVVMGSVLFSAIKC